MLIIRGPRLFLPVKSLGRRNHCYSLLPVSTSKRYSVSLVTAQIMDFRVQTWYILEVHGMSVIYAHL